MSADDIATLKQQLAEAQAEIERQNVALQALRSFVQHSPGAHAIFDTEMRYIAASQGYLTDYNITDKPYLGERHYDLFPEMPERWKDVHSRVLNGAIEAADADSFERPDGSITYNKWECRPWHRADGTIGGLITYTEVVTDKIRAEQQLTERESQLRSLIESSPDIITQLDTDFNIRFVYYPGQGILDDVTGANFLDVIADDTTHQITADYLQRVLDTGETQFFEGETFDALKGENRWHNTVYTPIKNTNGDVTAITLITRDITRQKQNEKTLNDFHQRTKKVFANIPAVIFTVDQDGLFTMSEGAALKGMGLEPGEVVGGNVFELYTDLPQSMEAIRLALTGQEVRYTAPVGDQIFENLYTPITDEDGNVPYMLGISFDVTHRETAAEERRQLQQQIIDAQQQALLDLSTPIIPIMDRVLIMPIIGTVDSHRARDIMRAVLQGISRHRAKMVIMDITGVPLVDTGVADHLNKTIQAARLKGAHTIVTGVSDAVAETVIDLGIDWSRVETLRDLQTGLVMALRMLGYEINKTKTQ